MTGPLLRFWFLLIAFLSLLLAAKCWFSWKPTIHYRASESLSPLPSPSDLNHQAATLKAVLLLHTTSPPLHCSIQQQGILLLTEKEMISPGEYRAAVNLAKGTNLLIKGDWPNDEPHSMRVEVLVHGYQTPLEKSFWAERSLEDTFPIPDSFLPCR